jgi:hypothetical protein
MFESSSDYKKDSLNKNRIRAFMARLGLLHFFKKPSGFPLFILGVAFDNFTFTIIMHNIFVAVCVYKKHYFNLQLQITSTFSLSMPYPFLNNLSINVFCDLLISRFFGKLISYSISFSYDTLH